MVACTDMDRATLVQQAITTPYFRPYTNDDVIGCELGGAVKNVIALAYGMADRDGARRQHQGHADHPRAGRDRPARACALGADPLTFAGLAGLGDLVGTCSSPLSRNRTFGEHLGRGETLEQAQAATRQTAEGVKSCLAIRDLARAHGVEMPITEQVERVCHEGVDPRGRRDRADEPRDQAGVTSAVRRLAATAPAASTPACPTPAPGEPFLPGPVFAAPYHLDPVDRAAAGADGYGRPDNPTRRLLEAAIGELEGGDCLAFASGLAAITAAAARRAAARRHGGAARRRLLHGPRRSPRRRCAALGVTRRARADRRAVPVVRRASGWCCWRRRPTRAWTCATSPRWPRRAHAAGALVAVDNTTATPLGQRPLDLGADLVVASGTKALTGHSDLLLGYVATRDAELLDAAARPGATHDRRRSRAPSTPGWRTGRWPPWTCGWPGRPPTPPRSPTLLAGRAGRDRRCAGPGCRPTRRTRSPRRQMRRIPGVVTFDLGAADAGGAGSSTRVAAGRRGDLVRRPAHHAPTGGRSGATTPPPGFVRLSCGIEDTGRPGRRPHRRARRRG